MVYTSLAAPSSTQSTTVWATLAAIASRRNQLDICEEAFSAVLQVDKVDYLNHVKVSRDHY